MNIIKISEHPELSKEAAGFFHNIWQVPLEAYLESMKESLTAKEGVPEWYIIKDNGKIIAGLGVIENDFHKRHDLRPNICAVYVNESYRKQGLARRLLDTVCENLSLHGVTDVYLTTDHTDFYERCGWDFYGMIEGDSGEMVRCYHRKTKL